jgi:hypothetical protein
MPLTHLLTHSLTPTHTPTTSRDVHVRVTGWGKGYGVSGGSRRHHVVRSPVAAVPLPHSLTHTHTHTLTRGIHHPQKDEIFWVHHSGLLFLFFLIVGYPSSDYHHCSTGRQTSRTRYIYMLHACTCTCVCTCSCTCTCTCTCMWFSSF